MDGLILRLMKAWKRLDTMTGTCYVENSDARQDYQERLIATRLLTNYPWRTRGSFFPIFSVDPYLQHWQCLVFAIDAEYLLIALGPSLAYGPCSCSNTTPIIEF